MFQSALQGDPVSISNSFAALAADADDEDNDHSVAVHLPGTESSPRARLRKQQHVKPRPQDFSVASRANSDSYVSDNLCIDVPQEEARKAHWHDQSYDTGKDSRTGNTGVGSEKNSGNNCLTNARHQNKGDDLTDLIARCNNYLSRPSKATDAGELARLRRDIVDHFDQHPDRAGQCRALITAQKGL